MRIRSILLMFSLLLLIGMAMLAVETLWASEVVYEVVVPVELPEVFSGQAVLMLVEIGWLRPEGARQLATAEGSSCHEVVSWCGGNSWCRYCKPGSGIVRCACSASGSPNTR